MPEPIVTTGVALIGAGTWFANKVFGPSADSLGDTLRVFLSDRVSKVFAKAEELATEPSELQQIPPGFLVKFVQSASFSEDDEIITEMWANLLLNSSRKFSQRQVLYLDILDKLSADDAKTLNEMIAIELNISHHHSVQWTLDGLQKSLFWQAQHILSERSINHFDCEAADKFDEIIGKLGTQWPIKFLESIIPYSQPAPDESSTGSGSLASLSSRGRAGSEAPFDSLIRQRLVQSFQVSLIAGFEITVAGVMATPLGVEFVESCRGRK